MNKGIETPNKRYNLRDLERHEDLKRFFYRFSQELVPTPGEGKNRLLDLGCGMAEFARFSINKGWLVSVADISVDNVRHASELGIDTRCLDLNMALPYEDKSFNLVTLIEVLEHIMNAEMLVDEIYRVLADDGHFLLSTPNYAFYKHRLNGILGKAPPEEGRHLRFFIKRKLKNILISRGFRIVKINSFGYLPLFNKIMLRRMFGKEKIRFRIPYIFETIFAEHFVWLMEKKIQQNKGQKVNQFHLL